MTEFKNGIIDAIPTGFGYISIGLAFGVIASSSGLSPLAVALMSALIYGGSAQFAFCALLLAKAPISTMVLTIFLVNLRNMLMSLHAATLFSGVGFWNGMAIASLITDESYGLLLGYQQNHEEVPVNWMHGNNLFSYLIWVVATTLGASLGGKIGNPETLGLDFALVAMFIALLWNQIIALLKSVNVSKILLLVITIVVVYSLSSILLSEALSVLVATLIACFVGVASDDY